MNSEIRSRTHKSQFNELFILLKKYKDFMPLCPEYELVKLCNEIIKISNRLEYISSLNDFQVNEKVVFHYETANSKMNSQQSKI